MLMNACGVAFETPSRAHVSLGLLRDCKHRQDRVFPINVDCSIIL